VIQSIDESMSSTQLGIGSDILTPGDYDGDGRIDHAGWRDANGIWFLRRSSTGARTSERWGLTGDIPMPSASVPNNSGQ
jgi:hypothetical protein